MIHEVTRYLTDDGTEHTSREDAERHEMLSALVTDLQGGAGLPLGYAEDAARYLLTHYNLSEKD